MSVLCRWMWFGLVFDGEFAWQLPTAGPWAGGNHRTPTSAWTTQIFEFAGVEPRGLSSAGIKGFDGRVC